MRRLERKIVMYLSSELLVAIAAILGNGLVAMVYIRDKRLRTPTNFYIFSLAIVNLLTSTVAIPAYLNSLISPNIHHFTSCLFINSSLVAFCTISILHLVAVSFDRYIAVVCDWNPRSYRRGMVHAVGLTLLAWVIGGVIGWAPLMGWHKKIGELERLKRCEFLKVMEPSYLLFIFYATVLTPSILLIFFYVSIYFALRKHVAQKRTERLASVHDALDTTVSIRRKSQIVNGTGNESAESDQELEIQFRRDIAGVKGVTFSLLLVIIFFHICWYPLHIMNVIGYYHPKIFLRKWHFYAPIVLSHASNAINPLIYGFTMPKFREAFLNALLCKQGTDGRWNVKTRRGRVIRRP